MLEDTTPSTENALQSTDPEDLPLDEECRMSNDEAPRLSDLQHHPLNEESPMSTDNVLRFTNLHEFAIGEVHSSFMNDEVLQISFDMESDDVECILSPNALNMSDDEIMFRDRESVIHIAFADTETTIFDDLIIEKVATHDDVECILSPLPLVDADFTTFDESDAELQNDAIIQNELTASTDVEIKHIAPSSLESPESFGNKENAENFDDVEKMASGKRKDNFFVDTSTTKTIEDMNSSSSSAFLRSALSPTN